MRAPSLPDPTSPASPPGTAGVSLFDARPFFEKALQHGVRHGIIDQAKLDAICREAPKGMVQIAAYFGSEFLRPELERARERIVNLVSLHLEDACGGDLTLAAQSLRDHSLLSRSKAGSDMLKRLIAMPQSSHFAMHEGTGFTNDHIPQLAKWSLRSFADYRTELARRTHAAQLMEAAQWLAEDLGLDADELAETGTDADAVIRTALLVLARDGTDMPDWRAFGQLVLDLRQAVGTRAEAVDLPLPAELPVHLHAVTEAVRQSVLADLPAVLDAAQPIRKLFHQNPAFMGRYFWLDGGLAEVDHHDRAVSATWQKATGGHTDEASLLTLFLGVATGQTKPKTLLTETQAKTLLRKARKAGANGLDDAAVRAFIAAHAPMAYQAAYGQLWTSFMDEARATLLSDADPTLGTALALLRRECNVRQA